MSSVPRLELTNVHKCFGDKQVLSGLDLEIYQGESIAVIGGSGSGKSVMLKCILGLLNPEKGSILVDGDETIQISDKAREKITRKFGMLFQSAALFDSLPIWKNIIFGLEQQLGKSPDQYRHIALNTLEKVGLDKKYADSFPHELSTGMRKRVGLARAIARNPDILFFDEPTTGLDPLMGDIINELILQSVKDLGSTALTITHDMASVRTIADRVAMLYNGKIIWVGPTTLLDDSGNEFVEQFVKGKEEGPMSSIVA